MLHRCMMGDVGDMGGVFVVVSTDTSPSSLSDRCYQRSNGAVEVDEADRQVGGGGGGIWFNVQKLKDGGGGNGGKI